MTFKNAFWEIGAAILDKTRPKTLFDDKAEICDQAADMDNIDIVHATAEKLSILRPVLKPSMYSVLLAHARKHCIEILEQAIQAFYREKKRSM